MGKWLVKNAARHSLYQLSTTQFLLGEWEYHSNFNENIGVVGTPLIFSRRGDWG
jgi:hypothetical protein